MQIQKTRLKTRDQSSTGFTLLEVLVAMALLAIISGALYSTYFTLVRGRERATEGMESRRELRGTLDMLRREIAAASLNPGNKRLYFVVEDRDFFGKPASTLGFTTISPPLSGTQPVSDQMAVQYKPVEKDHKMLLTRQAQDLYLTTDPLPYPQMEEVEGFLVECYDGGKWIRTWNAAPGLNSSLPKSVRVTITMKEGDKAVNFVTTASPQMVPL